MSHRHVCLLGTGNSWVDAPFGDPNVEMWAVGSGKHLFHRVDRFFELHKLKMNRGKPMKGHQVDAAFFEWAVSESVPIYMTRKHEAFPSSVKFPKDAVLASCGKQYFTCTIAWMIGLAIHERVDELSLFGIELSAASEYGFERPCAEHWLGFFEGAGGTVHVSNRSVLCTAAELYGYREQTGASYLYAPHNTGPDSCRINMVRINGMTIIDPKVLASAVQ